MQACASSIEETLVAEGTNEQKLILVIVRGSPILLPKTVSHISNWPFHASRKIRKTALSSQQKASNHVSRKKCEGLIMPHIKYKFYSRIAKYI